MTPKTLKRSNRLNGINGSEGLRVYYLLLTIDFLVGNVLIPKTLKGTNGLNDINDFVI